MGMGDWEHMVKMYFTGEGTVDGKLIQNQKRGKGNKLEDRKQLEKKRTLGKTFEMLGRQNFEQKIGYKRVGNRRQKRKIHQVLARCRIASGVKKSNPKFSLPQNIEELTLRIDRGISEKENEKETRKLAKKERAETSAREQGMDE